MNVWQQWVQRPQNLWIRRALFQVHLWVGIAIGIYIFLVSVSGSAIVYRPQLMNKFARTEPTVTVVGERMDEAALREQAQKAYRGYEVAEVFFSRRLDHPTTVVLTRGRTRFARLFNPYTGADIGDPRSPMESLVEWLVDFHDNLLSGDTGRLWNGIGSILVMIVGLTGAFLWWPGIRNWRRSTTVNLRQNFQVFNWRLHSAVGFWCFVFVMLWGLSGIYFIFPQPFNALFGDSQILVWLPRLHFGRFFGRGKNLTWYGPSVAALWVAFGLVPAVLVVTGVLMWWNRVLRRRVMQQSE